MHICLNLKYVLQRNLAHFYVSFKNCSLNADGICNVVITVGECSYQASKDNFPSFLFYCHHTKKDETVLYESPQQERSQGRGGGAVPPTSLSPSHELER